MVRIAIPAEAFDAIVATLPVGSVGYEVEANAKGERVIWLARLGRQLAAMRSSAARFARPRVRSRTRD